MKKRSFLIVLMSVLMCSSMVLFGCSFDDEPTGSSSSGGVEDSGGEDKYISSNWEAMPENTNNNLKYFGYFHSDGFLSQGSYIEEIGTLKNANIAMINSASGGQIAKERIELAKANGMKAILSVPGCFFYNGKITVANSASLHEDYQVRFDALCAEIRQYIDDGTLLSFYIDEPAWNGVKEEDFRTATKYIREKCPDTKLLTTMTVFDIGVSKKEGYPEINASYNEFCTDVSYDSYVRWNDKARRTYLEALKSKATNNQYIWGCATGFSNNPEQTEEMILAIKGMYTEAIQEPRYAGILPFSYADGFEGDWGYGLRSFFDNTSDYYDRDFKQLYINIGREVIGLPPYDFSQDVEVILHEPFEVYSMGEEITLPAMGATDGLGNGVGFTCIVTAPDGSVVTGDPFVAEQSGNYTVTVTAGEGEKQVSKSVLISVRQENEISLFDGPAYLSDADGTDADKWCWPRQVVTNFSHCGSGSLKVTPHATDGTWPRVIFARNGYQLWDISQYDYISMWVYNDSDEGIKGFSLMVSDEQLSAENNVFTTEFLPSKQWVEVRASVANIKAQKPDLDLTKVTIFYGNSASDYANRGAFYIDDVLFLKDDGSYEAHGLGFEKAEDINRIGGTADDLWCWKPEISTSQAHLGSASLRVTPHATDGTWPNVVFTGDGKDTFDLTYLKLISLWVYFDSDNAISTLGFKINNGEGVNQYIKTFEIPSRTWTEITVTKEEITNGLDFANASVSFSQVGGIYTDRSVFYLDDLFIEYGEVEKPVEPEIGEDGTPYANGFETDDEVGALGNNPDDIWTWPLSGSSEQFHDGASSIKVTVRQDGGVWPNVVFKNGTDERFNIKGLDIISMWVYFDSVNAVKNFAIKVDNGEGINRFMRTYEIPAKTWTKLVLSVEDVKTAVPELKLTEARIAFCQSGGTYDDRSNFYIDDFAVAKAEKKKDVNLTFESSDDITLIGGTADDIWCWKPSISNEQAHLGISSLKVTPHATDGTWPNVVFKGANEGKFDLTAMNKISLWVYFDSDNAISTLGFKINNGEGVNQYTKTFEIPSRTWTEITVTKEEITNGLDFANATISFSQLGGTYTDRSVFYLDDFCVA